MLENDVLESELRAVMAEETAALQAPADLVVRVVRGARRRRARIRLAAVAVATAVAAAAVPAYVTITRPPVVAPQGTLIDGIRIGYVPDDLAGSPRRTSDTMKGMRGTMLRWSRGERKLQIGVYHGDPEQLVDSMNVLALNVLYHPIEPAHAGDPVVANDGREMVWIPRRGVVVDVLVSPALKGEIGKIAAGVDVPWERSMAGITVGYMPAGLRPTSTVPEQSAEGLSRTWAGPGGVRAVVEVVYGMRATSLDALRPAVFPDPLPVDVGARPGLTSQRTVLWMIRAGMGVRVSVTGLSDGELMKIAAGVTALPQDAEVERAPANQEEADPYEAIENGRIVHTRTWAEPAEPAAFTSVSVYRGRVPEESAWWDVVLRGAARPARMGGHAGYRSSWVEQRSGLSSSVRAFAWRPEEGLTVVVAIGTSASGSSGARGEPLEWFVGRVRVE